MPHRLLHLSPSRPGAPAALPGLRPGVVMIRHEDEVELRDNVLGQVVRLGDAAAVIVGLLDGVRDAAAVLMRAGQELGGALDPMGLVDLLQALDKRALLDTPRARAIVSQGLVRADVAALRRISQRNKPLVQLAANPTSTPAGLRMAEGSRFSCNSCTRCCTGKHLLGPVSAAEVRTIVNGFKDIGLSGEVGVNDFLPLGNTNGPPESFLLRTNNDRCIFLQDDNLCRIHAALGGDFKPAACRLFPFRPVRTPEGWNVGLSLSCPTVVHGEGQDPRAEALETITSVARSSSLLQVISEPVALSSGCKVPWASYMGWENGALEQLQDQAQDPAVAWLGAIESFEDLLREDSGDASDPWLTLADTDECATVEMPEASNSNGSGGGISNPLRGQGQLSADMNRAADVLLRDLAVWLELLIGLEAADPMAIRRLRKGMVQLRSRLDFEPLAAPVLAEEARLEGLMDGPDGSQAEDTLPRSMTQTHPAIRRPKLRGNDQASVLRRFLLQALMGKAVFRFSTVRRGLVAVTLHLALLSLNGFSRDPYALGTEDVSYLFQHPQFTDIIDSRAVTQHHTADGQLHRLLLGL